MLMLMMSVCQCNEKEEQDMRIICIAASIADIMLSAAFKQNQQAFPDHATSGETPAQSCRHNVR